MTAVNCEKNTAAQEMLMFQQEYESFTGKPFLKEYGTEKRKSTVLITLRQSFRAGEVDADTAHAIGCKLVEQFFGDKVKYQYVVATHINSHCIHNHITFNVLGSDLRRFRENIGAQRKLITISDRLCDEYGLSVVAPNPQRDRRHRFTWINPTSYRTVMKNDIDRYIAQSKTFEDFLAFMGEDYFCKKSGKYLSFRHRSNGQKRNIRVYTLGNAYTESAIRQRIATGVFIPSAEMNVDYLPTYSQKLRDIKTMFHAKGVLRENNISQYSDFAPIIAKVSEQTSSLQSQMQDLEMRTDEIQLIADSFDTIREKQEVMDGLNAALLKDRYRLTHRDDIVAYQSALTALQSRNIDPHDTAQIQKYSELRDSAETELRDLWSQFEGLQTELEQINAAKRQIEHAYMENEKVKKEGFTHDR